MTNTHDRIHDVLKSNLQSYGFGLSDETIASFTDKLSITAPEEFLAEAHQAAEDWKKDFDLDFTDEAILVLTAIRYGLTSNDKFSNYRTLAEALNNAAWENFLQASEGTDQERPNLTDVYELMLNTFHCNDLLTQADFDQLLKVYDTLNTDSKFADFRPDFIPNYTDSVFPEKVAEEINHLAW